MAAGVVGSLTNTVLVLFMIGVLGYLPWAALPAIAAINGLPEAVVCAIITTLVSDRWVSAVERLRQVISARIRAALAGEQGAIAAALITGERGGITHRNE